MALRTPRALCCIRNRGLHRGGRGRDEPWLKHLLLSENGPLRRPQTSPSTSRRPAARWTWTPDPGRAQRSEGVSSRSKLPSFSPADSLFRSSLAHPNLWKKSETPTKHFGLSKGPTPPELIAKLWGGQKAPKNTLDCSPAREAESGRRSAVTGENTAPSRGPRTSEKETSKVARLFLVLFFPLVRPSRVEGLCAQVKGRYLQMVPQQARKGPSRP